MGDVVWLRLLCTALCRLWMSGVKANSSQGSIIWPVQSFGTDQRCVAYIVFSYYSKRKAAQRNVVEAIQVRTTDNNFTAVTYINHVLVCVLSLKT